MKWVMRFPLRLAIETLDRDLSIEQPPVTVQAAKVHHRAVIQTPTGLKKLA
jgi:hypothetical protein